MSKSTWLMLFFLFATSAVTASPPEPGDNYRSADFISDCGPAKPRTDSCISFVRGVRAGETAQRLFMYQLLNLYELPISPQIGKMLALEPFCLPAGTSDADLAEIAISFIGSHDKDVLKANAGYSVLIAIATKYKCTKEDYDAIQPR
jgi:hypothetical protein